MFRDYSPHKKMDGSPLPHTLSSFRHHFVSISRSPGAALMTGYTTKDWLSDIFLAKKEDTIRRTFPAVIIACIYTAVIVFIERDWLKLHDTHPLKQFIAFHTLLGFAISLLMVFRTNTAYDRWWEARKQWGMLVSNSRNFAIKINSYLPAEDKENRDYFRYMVPLFAEALQKHLRSGRHRQGVELPPVLISGFNPADHVPAQIVSAMAVRLNQLYKGNVISGDQLIIINNELQTFLQLSGACERIKNTPIPYSYNTFTKKFIFAYTVTLPIGFSFLLGYFLIVVVALIFYILLSLALIAEDIENPFGCDAYDLPLQKFANDIKEGVAQVLL
jgi:putative membrane protein